MTRFQLPLSHSHYAAADGPSYGIVTMKPSFLRTPRTIASAAFTGGMPSDACWHLASGTSPRSRSAQWVPLMWEAWRWGPSDWGVARIHHESPLTDDHARMLSRPAAGSATGLAQVRGCRGVEATLVG